MKRILTILLFAIMLSVGSCLGINAEAEVKTPVSVCCIGDLYSVDYEFKTDGIVENVKFNIAGAACNWNYSKAESKLYISVASAVPIAKTAEIAAVISNDKITLTPVLVRLNGWITETGCIYHSESEMPEIKPTCDSDGSTGGTLCTRCGVTLTEPTVLPATGPIVKAELSEENVLTINGAVSDNAVADGAVLVGIYSDKRLVKLCDISKQNQTSIKLEIDNMGSADLVKIFRWESISNMKPISDDIEVKVTRYEDSHP